MSPLESNLSRRLGLVHIGCSQDGIGRNALLHPLDHGRQYIALGIQGRIAGNLVANKSGTVATRAVTHTTDSEKAVKVIHLGVVQTHGLLDVLIVSRRVETGNDEVGLAVVVQDLGTLVLDGGQVTVPGLDVERIGPGSVGIVSRVEGGGVPVGVIVNGIAEPILREQEWGSRVHEIGRAHLGTGLHGRVDEAIVLAVEEGLEELGHDAGLGVCQACARVRAGRAEEGIADGIVAQGGILDDAIDIPIDTITLAEDVGIDHGPHVDGYKGRGGRVALLGIERAAPGGQVVEGQGGGSNHPAVKVVGEVLGLFETLASTGRAAEVIRLGMFLAVEGLGDLLAQDDTGVQCAVGKVLDDIAVVVEGHTGLAVVAIVCAHGGEAEVNGVGEVDILYTTTDATIAGAREATGPGLVGGEPHLHGDVGAVRGRHEQGDPAHVHGDILGVLGAGGGNIRESQGGTGGDGSDELDGGVWDNTAHGAGKVGTFGVEVGGDILCQYR